jgi:hypothetical protein
MTLYGIFVLVLTAAYIIYYGYNISKDIYGKKGEAANTEEVFDIRSFADEVTATPVKEVDGGFSFGDNFVESQSSDTDNLDPGANKYEEALNQMEEVDSQSEGGLNNDEMVNWMVDHYREDTSTDAFRKETVNENRQVL